MLAGRNSRDIYFDGRAPHYTFSLLDLFLLPCRLQILCPSALAGTDVHIIHTPFRIMLR